LIASLLLVVSYSHAGEAELSDPTRPLDFQAAASQVPTYQLTSIFLSDTRARAIINGKLVGVNDHVGQAKVLKIEQSFVALQTPDGQKNLRLHKNVKRASRVQ
jgi:hypothetical protein